MIFANDVLQGEPNRAGQTLGRVVINSTLGIGGLVDVAAKMGIPRHDEDFGQTLGVWGVGEGPYLVLPLAGPSNPRDTTGMVADYFMDPLTYIKWNNSTLYIGIRTGMGFVDLRARNVDDAGPDRAHVGRPLRHHAQPLSPAPQRRNPQRRARYREPAEPLSCGERYPRWRRRVVAHQVACTSGPRPACAACAKRSR